MDLSRFFLYSALAIVTYLLLLSWNEDYPNQIPDANPQPQVTLAELPEPELQTASQSDIPSQIPPAQSAPGQAETRGTLPTGANLPSPTTPRP